MEYIFSPVTSLEGLHSFRPVGLARGFRLAGMLVAIIRSGCHRLPVILFIILTWIDQLWVCSLIYMVVGERNFQYFLGFLFNVREKVFEWLFIVAIGRCALWVKG
jgi:hypothetical protein